MNLLYDDQPRLFSPTLATIVGLNGAIVLQQVHFRLQLRKNHRDGRYWVYDSYEDWQAKHFPWWSVTTIRRTFGFLEGKGLIVSKQYMQKQGDPRCWVSIDYERFAEETGDHQSADQSDQHPPAVMITTDDQGDHSFSTKTSPKTPAKKAAAAEGAAAPQAAMSEQIKLLVTEAEMDEQIAQGLPERDIAYARAMIQRMRAEGHGLNWLYTAIERGNYDPPRPPSVGWDNSVEVAYRRAWDKRTPVQREQALRTLLNQSTSDGEKKHIEQVLAGERLPHSRLIKEVCESAPLC